MRTFRGSIAYTVLTPGAKVDVSPRRGARTCHPIGVAGFAIQRAVFKWFESRREYILIHMKSMLVELDDDVAARLERVAPAQSRQRSEFIRNAIRRALWELEERATADAYRRQPDTSAAYLSVPLLEDPVAEVSAGEATVTQ